MLRYWSNWGKFRCIALHFTQELATIMPRTNSNRSTKPRNINPITHLIFDNVATPIQTRHPRCHEKAFRTSSANEASFLSFIWVVAKATGCFWLFVGYIGLEFYFKSFEASPEKLVLVLVNNCFLKKQRGLSWKTLMAIIRS